MSKKVQKQTDNRLAIFEGSEIRRISVDDEWYSVVDVIKALTDSDNTRVYWNALKTREKEHGIELYTICIQLWQPRKSRFFPF